MNEKIPQGMERADAYVYSFLMTVFKDTPSVVRFLIQPEIMKKFNEEERAYMFETYCNLTGTAFEEIAEDDNPWTDQANPEDEETKKLKEGIWFEKGPDWEDEDDQ